MQQIPVAVHVHLIGSPLRIQRKDQSFGINLNSHDVSSS